VTPWKDTEFKADYTSFDNSKLPKGVLRREHRLIDTVLATTQ
jgi:hypothetical protein